MPSHCACSARKPRCSSRRAHSTRSAQRRPSRSKATSSGRPVVVPRAGRPGRGGGLRFDIRSSSVHASIPEARSAAMPNPLLDAFLAGDVAGAAAHLAPDATFHSPVADYEGRDRIAALWSAVAQVLRAPRPTAVIEGDDGTVAFFTATFDGRAGDGMLRVVG